MMNSGRKACVTTEETYLPIARATAPIRIRAFGATPSLSLSLLLLIRP
jgi:hypothetical protein